MFNPSGFYLDSTPWIVGVSIILLANLASSSDPCPQTSIWPCWCEQRPVNGDYNWTTTYSEEPWTTTSTYSKDLWSTTSTPVPTTATPTSSSTTYAYYPTYTEISERRRRRRRQADTSLSHTDSSSGHPYYTIVTCDNVNTSVHDLEDIVGKGLNRMWIDALNISNYPQTEDKESGNHFPNRFLKSVRLFAFLVTHARLSGDCFHHGNPFEGQSETLMFLQANNCFQYGQLSFSDIGTVNTMGLHKLKRLEYLEFSHNSFETIRRCAFRYLRNLAYIKLERNHIKDIAPGAFENNKQLLLLDLSHNCLETIDREIFPCPAKHLKTINLSWNKLTELPPDLFTDMPKLKEVLLNDNNLNSLAEKPWASVWPTLGFVDVTGNFLHCDCSLLWLTSLSHNSENRTTDPGGPYVNGFCSVYGLDFHPERYALTYLHRSHIRCSEPSNAYNKGEEPS